MKYQWSSRLVSLMLAALMLLAQIANANHDLEHQVFEHTELCQAFVTADAAPAIELEEFKVEKSEHEEIFHELYRSYSGQQACTYNYSRAPPRI